MPEPLPHNEIQEEMEKIERKRKLHALLLAIGFGLIVLIVLLLLFRDQIFGPGPGLEVDPTDTAEVIEEDTGSQEDQTGEDSSFVDTIYDSVIGSPPYQAIYGALTLEEMTLEDLEDQIQFCEDQITELTNQINDGQIQVNSMTDQIGDAEAQIEIYQAQIDELQAILDGGGQIDDLDVQITDLQAQIQELQAQIQTWLVQIAQYQASITDWQGQINNLTSQINGVTDQVATFDPQITSADPQFIEAVAQVDAVWLQIQTMQQQVNGWWNQIELWLQQFSILFVQFVEYFDSVGGFSEQLGGADDLRNVIVSIDLERSLYAPETGSAKIVGSVDLRSYSENRTVTLRVRHQAPGGEVFVSNDVWQSGSGGADLFAEIASLRNANNDRATSIAKLQNLQAYYEANTINGDYAEEINNIQAEIDQLEADSAVNLFLDAEFQSLLNQLEEELAQEFIYPLELQVEDIPVGSYFEIIPAPSNIDDFTPVGDDQDRYVWDLRPDQTGFQEGGFGPWFTADDTTAASQEYDACLSEAQGYYDTVYGSGVYTTGGDTCQRQSVLDAANNDSGDDDVPSFFAYDDQPDLAGFQQSELYSTESTCLTAAEDYYDVAFGTNNTYPIECFPAEFGDQFYDPDALTPEEQATSYAEEVAEQIRSAQAFFGPTPFAILPRITYEWFFYQSFSPLTVFTADFNLDGTPEEVYFDTQAECQRVGREYLEQQDPDFVANPREVTCYRREVSLPTIQWYYYESINPPVVGQARFSSRASCEEAAGLFHGGNPTLPTLLDCFQEGIASAGLQIRGVEVIAGDHVRILGTLSLPENGVTEQGVRIQWGSGTSELVNGVEQEVLSGTLGIDREDLLINATPIVALVNAANTPLDWAYDLTGLTPGRLYYFRIIDADTGLALSGVQTFRTTPLTANFNADLGELTQVTLGSGDVVPVIVSEGGLVPCGHDGDNPGNIKNGQLDEYEVCAFEHLVLSADRIIKWLFRFGVAPVAAMALTYAGVSLFLARDNPERLKFAKAFLWRVVIGVIVALSAWIIVASIISFMGVKRQVWYFDADPSTETREYGPAYTTQADCSAGAGAYYASQGITADPICYGVPTSYVLLGGNE